MVAQLPQRSIGIYKADFSGAFKLISIPLLRLLSAIQAVCCNQLFYKLTSKTYLTVSRFNKVHQ